MYIVQKDKHSFYSIPPTEYNLKEVLYSLFKIQADILSKYPFIFLLEVVRCLCSIEQTP